ncbi:MAG: S8 family serine peptidase [Thermoanaerobaculia bacterium]
MKRFVWLVAIILFISSAGLAAETHRYLVATRGAPPQSADHIRVLARDGGTATQEHHFYALRHVNGFIADMTAAEAEELRNEPGIVAVERDHQVHLLGTDARAFADGRRRTLSTVSADSVSTQITPYGITAVHAPDVWPYGRGAGIKVGIIDTGITKNHPDLASAYAGGFDFVENDDDPQDENGHGTHVAGTIGARDNGIGVIGVAPDVQIYSLRILGADGNGSVSDEVKAVDWAIGHGINVINLSLGAPDSSVLEEDAFQRAYDAGIVTVAASGNESAQAVDYPGAYPTVISVGAVDDTATKADFSNAGNDLKVAGPGVGVFSTYKIGGGEEALVSTMAANFLAFSIEGSPAGTVTGQMVYCGKGGAASDFPSAVKNNIALIDRGDFTFNQKVKNAITAGATGVIIANNQAGASSFTLIRDGNNQIIPAEQRFPWVLSIAVGMKDGASLKPLENGTVTLSIQSGADYAVLQGTSMATPHVAGVAALIWSLDPSKKGYQVRNAILATAHDLGPVGWDPDYGFGEVDALAAAKRLVPELFPSTPRHRPLQTP